MRERCAERRGAKGPPASERATREGELAQLGERLVCNQEVTGSSPVFSIKFGAKCSVRSAACWQSLRRAEWRESFAEALVPVKDSLDAAAADTTGSVETLKNGVQLTIKQLTAAFEKGRVTMIDPAGEKFDPAKHQAISMVEAGGEPNRVVSVLQKGYLIYDRVLRPALVTVSKAKAEQPAA